VIAVARTAIDLVFGCRLRRARILAIAAKKYGFWIGTGDELCIRPINVLIGSIVASFGNRETKGVSMGIHLQIIHPKDFLVAKTNGILDREASFSLLSKIIADHPEGEDLLIDLRDVEKFVTSILDVTEIINYMLENIKVFRYKIAVLGDRGKARQPEFVEDYAYNRGLDLRIFCDFEAAILWLMKISPEK
jgi:hypothetical protein